MPVTTGSQLTTDTVLRCQVCVIGSGAGGAVLAAGLVAAGLDVVMLEEGGHHTKADFDGDESRAYPMLYQERLTRATADAAISILQGRSVGGSTTVNWTTCFRTPQRVLAHWQERYGLTGLTEAALRPHFEAVEQRLNIHPWPVEQNQNNQVLSRGCEALGWEWSTLRRNVNGCANSGYCGLGCPYDAKQAMGVSYLQDALAQGLRLYSDVSARRLVKEDGRIRRVEAEVLDRPTGLPAGPRLVVEPQLVVLSGGAINNPMLLLRSGLNPNGLVGHRTMLHPVVALPALYEREIKPFYGAPQSAGSHHFIDRGERPGFFLEVPPLQPMLASSALMSFGPQQAAFMSQLAHLSSLLGLVVDGFHPGSVGGVVSQRGDGRVQLDYPVTPALAEAFQAAHLAMARIHLAAGAREILTLHPQPLSIKSEADLAKLETAPFGALEHSIFSAHQMGGCQMGADPETSVVDPEHRLRGTDNCFVVDGSVLPTALGVNPSETIYGLAHRARDFVLGALPQ